MPNIRNAHSFMSSMWDWTFLNECFGSTKIRVTDLDGLIERNGRFLVLETKGPGKDIPLGQRITFENMLATGLYSVIVIWGEPNIPSYMTVWTRHGTSKTFPSASLQTVQERVKEWFSYANSCARPKAYTGDPVVEPTASINREAA